MIGRILTLITLLVGVANIGLFIAWATFGKLNNHSSPAHEFDYIAFQLDVLSIVITVVGAFLAVLGVIGYSAIREHAVRSAQESARDVAEIELQKIIQQIKDDWWDALKGHGAKAGADVKPENVKEMSDTDDLNDTGK